MVRARVSHDSLVRNVNGIVAGEPEVAVFRFAPSARLEASAYVEPEKWTASMPAGASRHQSQ